MEKFLNRKVIYDGKVVRLELDQVQCSNGLISDREIVRHHGGVRVLEFEHAFNLSTTSFVSSSLIFSMLSSTPKFR